ncbi:hypothetical protein CFS9_39300 [Flavobacterium sp. CFS9]|uniref:Uncharacterized protein n=1 Tax=Flavobacterium sp. CFS9 TaxID=3143118 RepID=A0AAT9H708_9FLAO
MDSNTTDSSGRFKHKDYNQNWYTEDIIMKFVGGNIDRQQKSIFKFKKWGFLIKDCNISLC